MSEKPVDPSLPVAELDFQLGATGCAALPACDRYVANVRSNLVGRYFAEGAPSEGQLQTALIDLRGLTYDDYIAVVKKRYKGNVVRDARRSDKAGFVCRPFVRKMHIPDLVEINHSKERRAGGLMRAAYLKSVEEMGGAPVKRIELESPACGRHYDQWWGVFEPTPGHVQGEVVTDEKLIAYIDFRRLGNLALYSLIIGHGDYLKHGIMYRLHFEIMQWILGGEAPETGGLEFLMYAGFHQGGEGLQLWKKKTAFQPMYVVLSEDAAAGRGGLWRRLRRMLG